MLLRCPADFAVHDAVVGKVFHEFLGHAEEALFGLHHGDRVVKRFEVADQGAGVCGFAEPLPQRHRIGGRQGVPHGFRKFDDGGRAQAAVQVVVQGYLGEALEVEVDGRGSVKNRLSHVPTLGSDGVRRHPESGSFGGGAGSAARFHIDDGGNGQRRDLHHRLPLGTRILFCR